MVVSFTKMEKIREEYIWDELRVFLRYVMFKMPSRIYSEISSRWLDIRIYSFFLN